MAPVAPTVAPTDPPTMAPVAPTNPPVASPTNPPASSGPSVCNNPGPTGNMVMQCQKCLTETQYTDAGCVFDGDAFTCADTATNAITTAANCPSSGDNKRPTNPVTDYCDG